ncbi:MAG: hypothetical protein Q7U88_15680 [Desulfocapsaceae bacterium]|nr:hypothetical protein [Desulfocapsaceae bacterium]
MRILKIENCPSLSGNSRLTYHIGCSDQGDIQFRLQVNTASGYFSKEWVSLVHMEPILSSEKITSGSLRPLFKGKSVNSSGFLFSVLIHEGIVERIPQSRSFVRTDPGKFLLAIKALMESDVSLDATQPPTKPIKTKKEAK